MVDIKIVNSKDEWNSKLLKTENYNVFSSYEWGEYKSSSWKVNRLAFYKGGNFLGQSQFLMKDKYKIVVAWNSGGINLVNYKSLELIVEAIKDYFKEYTYNFRFNFYDVNKGEKLYIMTNILDVSEKRVNSGFSLIHYLKKDSDLLKNMSSKHRYYYKKATKNDFMVRSGSIDLVDDFVSLHHEMILSKDLSHLKIDKNDIINLYNNFENNFLIFSVYLNDKVVSSCLILMYENHAFYYLAASNEIGRKTYASYFMVKELLDYLLEHNITQFDFAGITPYDKNATGVNKFKIGFGGELVNYLGEWELSNSKFLTKFINKVYL